MRLVPMIALGVAPLIAVDAARAQSARWELSGGESSSIKLVFDGCAPDGEPALPMIPGVLHFRAGGRTESTRYTAAAGAQKATHILELTYTIPGKENARVSIPAFEVKTNKGVVTVPAFEGTLGTPMPANAKATFTLERASVWAGEVFDFSYELSIPRRRNPQIAPTFTWSSLPLIVEDWSKPNVTEAVVEGDRRLNVVFRSRGIARLSQPVKFEAASHLVSVQTGAVGFGVISQPRMEQLTITSDQPTLDVRPLPAPPEGFTGAVGQFTFTSKVVPETVAVGEPVTWTLELRGTGNWPEIRGLPEREASNDFDLVLPPPRRTPENGKIFNAALVEDAVLLPTRAGTYTLDSVTFSYFDPATGSYQTGTTLPATVTVQEAKPIAPENPSPAPAAVPARPGLRKFGGTPPKQAGLSAPADPALAQYTATLAELRRKDSPAELFQLMKKSENASEKTDQKQ